MRRVLLVVTVLSLVACAPAAATPHPTSRNLPTRHHQRPEAQPARTLADIYRYAQAVKAARYRKALAYMAALERQRKARAAYPHGLCGGDLPTCAILRCESRGDIHAQNPRSSASGKWQIVSTTWRRFRGWSAAKYAPERDQDDRARQIWDHGRGRRQWAC